MPRELPGVHQVVSHDCVVTGGLGLVAHELHDALGDALDRLGGDLGGGVTRPREPSTARHRRRGRVCPVGVWCDRERSHLGLHDFVFVVVGDGRVFPAVLSARQHAWQVLSSPGRQAPP